MINKSKKYTPQEIAGFSMVIASLGIQTSICGTELASWGQLGSGSHRLSIARSSHTVLHNEDLRQKICELDRRKEEAFYCLVHRNFAEQQLTE